MRLRLRLPRSLPASDVVQTNNSGPGVDAPTYHQYRMNPVRIDMNQVGRPVPPRDIVDRPFGGEQISQAPSRFNN
jgi:hypothetical protein